MTTWPIAAAPFIGSFLGVVALRLPEGQALVLGRSHCDHCGRAIAPINLIPLLGWLLRRGRCRYCGGPISLFYPMIELAAVAIALWAAAVLSGETLWLGCGLGWCLLTLAAIDWRRHLLPNGLTLGLLLAGLLLTALADLSALPAHLIGAGAGYGVFAGIAFFYRRWRGREGLGLGDAKLLAAAGAFTGWQALPGIVLAGALSTLLALAVASLLGHAVAGEKRLPFGPGLCLGFWLAFLYGPFS